MLKNNKYDIESGCYSDHIINGSTKLNVYLSLLYKLIVTHSYPPSSLLHATIIPIPQNRKKSLNNPNNYREIALGSIIGKFLDLIVLQQNRHLLESCNLQYGFKPKHSTTQCTFCAQQSYTILPK